MAAGPPSPNPCITAVGSISRTPKTSIPGAVKTGRLSASRSEDGGYDIEASEFSRVYPGNGHAPVSLERSVTGDPSAAELAGLRVSVTVTGH